MKEIQELSKIKQALDADEVQELFRLRAQNARLLEALIRAKHIIRGWHLMGHSAEIEQAMWQIYDKMSPEMKQINDAIAEAERKE